MSRKESDYVKIEGSLRWESIWYLAKRELLAYVRNKSRIITSIAQSLLFLFVFGAGFSQIPISIEGKLISSTAFVASGIAAMAVLFSGVFGGLGIIRDKLFGFMNELLVAPVTRRTLMLGKTLGVALQTLVQFMIITVLSAALGYYGYDLLLIVRIIATIPIGLLFSLGVVGIGMTVSTQISDFQGFGLIQTFLIMPMFWLSGALFAFNTVPVPMQVIMMINPISYGVDIFRFILLGVSFFPFWLDLLVLAVFGAILISIGAYSFNRMEIS
jgi:ABC-2 type transport system permease protein